MIIIVASLWIFIISVFVIELAFFAINTIRFPNRRKIRKRLQNIVVDEVEKQHYDILQKRTLSDVSFLDKVLTLMPGVQSLDRLIQQANSSYSAGFFILLSLFLVLTTILSVFVFSKNIAFAMLVAPLTGLFPIFLLYWKKKKRIAKFQKQLPEALELVARALKAGHAFTSGVKLAADEFDDPLGPEFEDTLDQINFGVSVPDALKNLAARIDCPELRFFVVSVILQRETGGNLAEIIESLARLIRERFKFDGKVRVLAAEGKLSAVILVALPFVIAILLRLINPAYMQTLFAEEGGRLAVGAALILMMMGIVIIKAMVKIKV
jgi:tight adherence protein B